MNSVDIWENHFRPRFRDLLEPLTLLLVLFIAISLGIGGEAYAQPAESGSPQDCMVVVQQIRDHNNRTEEHNNSEGALNHYDGAAVDQFNKVSADLNAEIPTLQTAADSCTINTSAASPSVIPSTNPTAKPSAQAAPKPSRAPPSKVERQNPVLPVEVKLDDEAYRSAYYHPDGKGGYSRRWIGQVDLDGQMLPKVSVDSNNPLPDGRPKIVPVKSPIPAKYVDGSETKESAPISLRYSSDPETFIRLIAIKLVAAWEAQKQREIAATGSVSQTTTDNLKRAYALQTDKGDKLGQIAGQQYMDVNYPKDSFDVNLISDPAQTGSGRFDRVYEVKDRATGKTKIVIIEEKGPSADLGERAGYQQGSLGYYSSTVDNMYLNGTDIERDLAAKLRLEMPSAIDYILVRARVQKIKKDGTVEAAYYDGYGSVRFKLDE
ncbi:hypothetical protein ACFXG4_36145 [Nocardia sp. NPDC059246]|uniref:hypothetical protein n=1 Tax=unclassified Nocardia TaxID=2637762 RepID=UPI0036D0A6BD